MHAGPVVDGVTAKIAYFLLLLSLKHPQIKEIQP